MSFENDFNLPPVTAPVERGDASPQPKGAPHLDLSNATELPYTVIAKRTKISKIFGIGSTLLRELHTPGSRNFDPAFPTPFTLTKNGSAYFDVHAVWAWIQSRQAMAVQAAASQAR